MTEQQIDRERLRAGAEHAVEMYGPAAWPDVRSADFLTLLDQLDQAEAERDRWHSMWRQRGVKHLAAEKRATRAEAQSAIRGRAVVMYRERAREAEARIKAVQHLIDQADEAGDWTVTCSRLQWAIDGEVV